MKSTTSSANTSRNTGEDGVQHTVAVAVAASKLGLDDQLRSAIASCSAVLQATDNEGRTCLHYAAACGHDECVEILLEAGADPLATDVKGDVPLHFAAVNKHPMCAYIITKAKSDCCLIQNKQQQTPVQAAVTSNSYEVLNAMLLACAGDAGRVAVAVMRVLLTAGAVPDTWAPNGSSALMLAASADATEALQVLLQNGATVELQDSLGRSALMFAAGNNSSSALTQLLGAGACLAQRDRRGRSVLDYAPENSAARTLLQERLASLEVAAAKLQDDLLASLEQEATTGTSAKKKSKSSKKKRGKAATTPPSAVEQPGTDEPTPAVQPTLLQAAMSQLETDVLRTPLQPASEQIPATSKALDALDDAAEAADDDGESPRAPAVDVTSVAAAVAESCTARGVSPAGDHVGEQEGVRQEVTAEASQASAISSSSGGSEAAEMQQDKLRAGRAGGVSASRQEGTEAAVQQAKTLLDAHEQQQHQFDDTQQEVQQQHQVEEKPEVAGRGSDDSTASKRPTSRCDDESTAVCLSAATSRPCSRCASPEHSGSAEGDSSPQENEQEQQPQEGEQCGAEEAQASDSGWQVVAPKAAKKTTQQKEAGVMRPPLPAAAAAKLLVVKKPARAAAQQLAPPMAKPAQHATVASAEAPQVQSHPLDAWRLTDSAAGSSFKTALLGKAEQAGSVKAEQIATPPATPTPSPYLRDHSTDGSMPETPNSSLGACYPQHRLFSPDHHWAPAATSLATLHTTFHPAPHPATHPAPKQQLHDLTHPDTGVSTSKELQLLAVKVSCLERKHRSLQAAMQAAHRRHAQELAMVLEDAAQHEADAVEAAVLQERTRILSALQLLGFSPEVLLLLLPDLASTPTAFPPTTPPTPSTPPDSFEALLAALSSPIATTTSSIPIPDRRPFSAGPCDLQPPSPDHLSGASPSTQDAPIHSLSIPKCGSIGTPRSAQLTSSKPPSSSHLAPSSPPLPASGPTASLFNSLKDPFPLPSLPCSISKLLPSTPRSLTPLGTPPLTSEAFGSFSRLSSTSGQQQAQPLTFNSTLSCTRAASPGPSDWELQACLPVDLF